MMFPPPVHMNEQIRQLIRHLQAVQYARQQLAMQILVGRPAPTFPTMPSRINAMPFQNTAPRVNIPPMQPVAQTAPAHMTIPQGPPASLEPVSTYSPPNYMAPGLWNWISSPGFYESDQPPVGPLPASGRNIAY